MSLSDKLEQREYRLNPNQAAYLNAVRGRLTQFEQQVIPKLNDLREAFIEASKFLAVELGVPMDKQFQVSADGTKLLVVNTEPVVVPQPFDDSNNEWGV